MKLNLWFLPVLLLLPFTAYADKTSVAVAANFTAPMKEIAEQFSTKTGHTATLSFGSSGKLFAQIRNNAPFELFLSADRAKPDALIQSGLAEADSRFTYALGRLVLWSADSSLINGTGDILAEGNFKKVAIANPRLAPYGQAAMEVLDQLGVLPAVTDKLVRGENISQTYQFVSSGNADMGFIALSQVYNNGELNGGSGWIVPQQLYKPIKQDAVLLTKGKESPAAKALLQFMQSPQARQIIKNYGYDLTED